jgi:hypothetical protein
MIVGITLVSPPLLELRTAEREAQSAYKLEAWVCYSMIVPSLEDSRYKRTEALWL